MKLIYVGKIVNTFGIKGELKIVSHFEMAEKVFKAGNIIRINNIDFKITNARYHKNNYLLELNNIKDINQIEYLKDFDVYFNEQDLHLKDNEYLISELIDYEVFNNGELIGKVTDYDDNRINPLIKVNNKFYIPLKGSFIKDIDKINKKIYTQDLEGLM